MLAALKPSGGRPGRRIAGEDAMTPEQIDLVRTSFTEVAAAGGDPAARFYQRLFELDPRLQHLFRGDPTAQRAKLMAALGAVVGALDRPQQILPAVRDLGRRHAHYGVEPEDYATVGSALIWALEQELGVEFTPATRRAWTEVYGLLAWTMMVAGEAELGGSQAA
jgi:hemoglobin-like flavoprotein